MGGEGDPYLLWGQMSFADRGVRGQICGGAECGDRPSRYFAHSGCLGGIARTGSGCVASCACCDGRGRCFDPEAGDIAQQLKTRFDPRHYRLDIDRANSAVAAAIHSP